MRIYDSYKKTFLDLPQKDHYSLYVCGVTPYDAAHIGHIATYLYFDVLVRHLEFNHKAKVNYIQNITDVDDSIIEFAKLNNMDLFDLARDEENELLQIYEKMNFRMPDVMPKVSTNIDVIVNFVEKLYSANFLYELNDAWYFDTTKIEDFGSLTGLDKKELLRLFNERGGNTEIEGKLAPLDFVVWSKEAPGEPSWDSLLGRGRPGWHIECSALVMDNLDTSIDIHGGGQDLFFPHHICEQAQTKALGTDLANIWMHSALVTFNGEKMSKSSGNLVYARGLLEDFSSNALRLTILKNHYREPLDWSNDLIIESESLDQLIRQTEALAPNKVQLNLEISTQVSELLDEDLNTPDAIKVIQDACMVFNDGYSIHPSDHADLIHALNVLGILP